MTSELAFELLGESPVSTSHLTISTLGLQTVDGYWEIETPSGFHASRALYLQSYYHSPLKGNFVLMSLAE